MTVELTNCQLQGVLLSVQTNSGVFAGGGGGGSICNENTFTTPSTNAKRILNHM